VKIGKPVVAVFDTKPYDRDYLSRATAAAELDWHFHEFRLDPETAFAAKGAQAVTSPSLAIGAVKPSRAVRHVQCSVGAPTLRLRRTVRCNRLLGRPH